MRMRGAGSGGVGVLGDRRVAARLAEPAGPGVEFLFDRRVPQTGGTIDLLGIARSGVWVIDVKRDDGRVARRDVGGLFRSENHLFVSGRDATSLVTGVQWQLDVVRDVIGSSKIVSRAAMCFVEAKWTLLARSFDIRGVRICGSRSLGAQLRAEAARTEQIRTLASKLSTAFPPTAA